MFQPIGHSKNKKKNYIQTDECKSRVHFVQNSINGKVRLREELNFWVNVTHNMCDSFTDKLLLLLLLFVCIRNHTSFTYDSLVSVRNCALCTHFFQYHNCIMFYSFYHFIYLFEIMSTAAMMNWQTRSSRLELDVYQYLWQMSNEILFYQNHLILCFYLATPGRVVRPL